MVETIALLCAVALAAGLTDSVVGGGGLVQLPALFLLLPHTSQALLLGTNKMSAVWGTAAAAVTYTRRVKVEFALTSVCAVVAFAASRLGAQAVAHVQVAQFKPFMLALLIGMAVFTVARKDFGALRHERVTGNARTLRGALIGAAVGFYDGFFGPGTGSILIFLFVATLGLDLLAASATAKIVNVCTNVGALAYFVLHGLVIYRYALPMAVFQIAGGILGPHLALKLGNRFVRVFFLCVMVAVIASYAWQVFGDSTKLH